MNMSMRNFIAAGASLAALTLVTAGCSTTSGASASPAEQRQAIDNGVDSALTRLNQEAAGCQALVAQAKGVLVFPTFVSAGFIIGGAQGSGSIRKAGKTTGYYRMTEASVGFLAGVQSQAVFILFMTDDALKQFEASNGWTAGADGSVSLINVGATPSVSSLTAQQPIAGFILTNSGLMVNASLNGSRITRLEIK